MNKDATIRVTSERAKLLPAMFVSILAVVFMCGMLMTASPTFAAVENATLNVQYTAWGDFDPQATPIKADSQTQLTLYRVGDCAKAGESWDITLVPALSNITLTKEEIAAVMNAQTESAGIQAWLAKAATIDNVIRSNPGLQKELLAKTSSSNPVSFGGNGTASFTGLSQGLYLLSGGSQWVESTDKYWSPQPMLIQVVQDRVDASLKPVSQTPVDEITLVKAWAGDKKKENAGLRPTAVKVVLSYDGEPVETVTLDKDNNWTYTYKTASGKKDPLKWSVAEEVMAGYSPSITSTQLKDGKITFTVTNTNDDESDTLKLVKSLPVFLSNGQKVNTVFTFEITGFQGSEKPYHKFVALSFDQAGQKNLEVEDIPKGLTKVMVREIPAANYKVKGAAEKEATLQGDTYSVAFENTWDDTHRYDGGVINKYELKDGKYRFDFREGIVKE